MRQMQEQLEIQKERQRAELEREVQQPLLDKIEWYRQEKLRMEQMLQQKLEHEMQQ